MITLIIFLLAAIALVLDALQTLQIALHPEKWKEVGYARFFIGEHPHPLSVLSYFTVCLWVVFVAWMLLPAPFGDFACAVVFAFECVVVLRNAKAGIPFK